MSAKFQVYQGKDDQFYFRLVAGNDQIILSSEGYQNQDGCYNGIDSVTRNSRFSNRYKVKKSSSKKHYFVITAKNNQVIATSQMYSSKQAAEKGIATVMKNVREVSFIETVSE